MLLEAELENLKKGGTKTTVIQTTSSESQVRRVNNKIIDQSTAQR